MVDASNTGATAGSAGDLLLGRDAEMGTLLGALEGVSRGRGRLVLLSGDAGIGKTRLADAFAAVARDRGFRVAWGRCWEAGGAPAYWPWLQAMRSLLRDIDPEELRGAIGAGAGHLAQILPELTDRNDGGGATRAGQTLDADRARFELFDALSSALRSLAARGPIVLILDDLHAADEPSLMLLRFVAMDVNDAPLLIVAIHREGEFEPGDPRIALLADAARVSAAQRLAPRALDIEEVGAFLVQAGAAEPPPGLVEAVHRATEGNPLFVSEVVRLLHEEGRLGRAPDALDRFAVTEGVRAVIGRRLARLSEPCRAVLARASAIGSELQLALIARIEDRPPDEVLALLDEAAVAHVLREVPGQVGTWRFAHALIRDVLYASLRAGERIVLHRRIGQTLEQLGATDTELPLAELAHHFVLAAPGGDAAAAVRYASAAAERATRLHAHEEAVRLYRLALGVDPLGDLDRCRLLIGLGEAATRAGLEAVTREAFARAADIAEAGGFVEELARAAVGYGGLFVWLRAGDDKRLVPLLERALAALPPGDSILRARLLSRLAGALRDEQSMDRRSAISAEAVAMARRLGDPQTLHAALSSRYAAATGPDQHDEMVALEREIRALTSSADPWQQFQLIVVTAFGGDDSTLREELERYGAVARELRQPPLLWYHGVMQTMVALADGRLADAEAHLEDNRRRGAGTMAWDASYTHRMGLIALRREQDRLDEVVDEIKRAVEEYPGYRHFVAIAVFADAALGRPDEARARLDRLARDGYRAFPRDHGFLFAMVYLGEAAVLLGDHDRAAEIEAILRPYGGRICRASGEISGGPVDRVRGLLAAFGGRHDEAVELLESAHRVAATGPRLWEVRCVVELAGVLVGRDAEGDRERASELLGPALEQCRALGLAAIEREANAVQARLLATETTAAAPTTAAIGSDGKAVFVREGDVWEIGRERVFRLRHSKGLSYLAALVASPGREFHALDLARVGEGVAQSPTATRPGSRPDAAGLHVDDGSGAAEAIDEQARAEYRDRIRELQGEVDEATAYNDPVRAERAQTELDALAAHLSAAFGLGGRSRRDASPAERARQSVTKAIRDAMRRIEAEDGPLGEHLERSVRTGIYVVYDPDPAARVTWNVTGPPTE